VGATEAETKCRVYFVTGSVYTDGSGASYPELYQGLIPIKYVDGNPTVADITQVNGITTLIITGLMQY
jgi:hypothetical protein